MLYKRTMLIMLFFSCTVTGFAQYVSGFPGAWYNNDGTVYIVNPHVPNECEIGHITIDYLFRVSQNPKRGIVYAGEDTSWRAEEVINFQNETIMVRDVLFAPVASPLDVFRSQNRRQQVIVMPEIGDSLAKRIYVENGIEVIRAGTTNEYHDLIRKLKGSRIVVFNNILDSPDKFIFKDMELIDYGERIGENDRISAELYNDREMVLRWECKTSRGRYPGDYDVRIHFTIYNVPEFRATHEVSDSLRLRLDQSRDTGVIMTLVAGSKVHVLEVGNAELIDGINANWVKVLTEDGYVGWCFSGYLVADLTGNIVLPESLQGNTTLDNELIPNEEGSVESLTEKTW